MPFASNRTGPDRCCDDQFAAQEIDQEHTYWVPGVNHLGSHARWTFAELTDVFQMQEDFGKKVATGFAKMIDGVVDK